MVDDNDKIEIDGIQYTVFELRQLVRSIKKGCTGECVPLSALQLIERDRREEMDRYDEAIRQQQIIDEKIRKDIE